MANSECERDLEAAKPPADHVLGRQVVDAERLTEIGRLGARLVLQKAVEEEVTAFLGGPLRADA